MCCNYILFCIHHFYENLVCGLYSSQLISDIDGACYRLMTIYTYFFSLKVDDDICDLCKIFHFLLCAFLLDI